MRTILLALALVAGVGHTTAQAQTKPTDDAIQLLVDKGEDEHAFALAQQGAEEGDPRAVEWVAWFYDNGAGVKQDLARAIPFYRVAAAAGQN